MRLRSVRQGHSGKMPPKRIGHRSEKELYGGRGAVPIQRNAARQPQRVHSPDEHYTHLHNQDAGRGSNGDSVWVRLPGARYEIRHHKVTVIGVVSEQAVEVDWMPRHVKDLRHRTSFRCAASDVSEYTAVEEEEMIIHLRPHDAADGGQSPGPAPEPTSVRPRRSTRFFRGVCPEGAANIRPYVKKDYRMLL
ncbi:hypothetical protein T07_6915 [Trichinella nelsoni]|uniref:Uncharacterized protein n=1 Tax=Trichinella nelsoni TaxID=6336 RepID=A0A0V0RWB7_9BILA|nr:hypothetical protein T07_6915 [Trichinella nelsoni]